MRKRKTDNIKFYTLEPPSPKPFDHKHIIIQSTSPIHQQDLSISSIIKRYALCLLLLPLQEYQTNQRIKQQTECNGLEIGQLQFVQLNIQIDQTLNQQMSDEEVAFDDWEAEAQAVVEEVKNQPTPTEEVQTKVESTEQIQKQKVEIVDPKTLLVKRIGEYRQLKGDKYDDYLQEIKGQSTNDYIKNSNVILKNDKDFAQFAKAVGKRFNQTQEEKDQIQENNLLGFVEELTFLLYEQTQWKNLEAVKEKLRIVKKQRKDEEIKAKKQKEKEQRLKKQQKLLQNEEEKKKPNKPEESKPQDDIFGGATLINSKQIQQELKNKQKVKVQTKPADDDDDDFM